MIKRTLYFGNPSYLSLRYKQLVITKPDDGDLPYSDGAQTVATIPIEDIGIVVLDNKQITITSALLDALTDNNVSVITCNSKSMPTGLLLNLSGHTNQSERFRFQIEASAPLRKQLWQQTIKAKIMNQNAALEYTTGTAHPNMISWAKSVKSGDIENVEGHAAAYYVRPWPDH